MSRREWREQQDQPAPTAVPDNGVSPIAPAGETLTILTVCTGNICRSPLAEVLLRQRLEPLGVRVHSAGTSAVEAMTETIGRGARDALERSTSVREGVLETMLRARRAETVRERRERWDERRRRRAATRVWCSRGRGTTGDARGDADSMD